MTGPGSRRRALVLGGRGFVGRALVARAYEHGIDAVAVGREDWAAHAGRRVDVVVCSAGSASKREAAGDPARDLDASVGVVYRAFRDFPCERFVLVSSVDVYPRASTLDGTREDVAIDLSALPTYGFHKRLAELAVERAHDRWLVVRCGQMLGPGLAKGPVFDLVHGRPRWVAERSSHVYLRTEHVARATWTLLDRGGDNQVFNVAGRGSVEVAAIRALLPGGHPEGPQAGSELQTYRIATDKAHAIAALPESRAEVEAFLRDTVPGACAAR
jgi:nucleoside-diphosphate-sugar epimerase